MVPNVLTIAGSDSGGGAGIQADLKTFAACGCYGLSVITALTAQNTRGVLGVEPASPAFVAQQLMAIRDDIQVHGIKTGMLHNAGAIAATVAALEHWNQCPLVVDPVMIAKGGAALLQDDAIAMIKSSLIPRATVVTPNIPEAERLSGIPIVDQTTMWKAAQALLDCGAQCVVIKGGHSGESDAVDRVYTSASSEPVELRAVRVDTKNLHGTGCTFSAATAAFLARGLPLLAALEAAKEFVTQAILRSEALTVGGGHGPLHHGWNFKG